MRPAGGPGLRVASIVFATLLAIELLIAVLGSGLKGIDGKGAGYEPGFGSPAAIGELLLTRFLFPFEAASFLLLMAAVGAVVLARRRGGLEGGDEEIVRTIPTRLPKGIGYDRRGRRHHQPDRRPRAARRSARAPATANRSVVANGYRLVSHRQRPGLLASARLA